MVNDLKPLPPVPYLSECLRLRENAVYWAERPESHFRSRAQQRSWNTQRAGRIAGTTVVLSRGTQQELRVRRVCLDQRMYLLPRIVWALFHGVDPGQHRVSPIDGDHCNLAPSNWQLLPPERRTGQRAGELMRYRHWQPALPTALPDDSSHSQPLPANT